MTTTPHRRARSIPGSDRLASAGERVLDPGVRRVVRGVVGELVESADIQAQQAGRQLRCIFRLWLLAWEDREIDWVSTVDEMTFEADERVCSLLETEDQLMYDVADEIGPALRLPAGTAIDRVREALVLALHLPEVLLDLEAGRFSARHAAVMADQWRELVEDVPPGEEAPRERVRRLVAELRERAPDCTLAQLRALARRRRAALLRETQERRHRSAWAGRRVWVEHGEDGMACLHAVLDAATAVAAQDRLDALVARLGPETGSGPSAFGDPEAPHDSSAGDGAPRTDAQLRADVLADLLLAGEVLDDPSFPQDVRGEVSVTVPVLTLLEHAAGPGADGTCLDALLNAGNAGFAGFPGSTGGEPGARVYYVGRPNPGGCAPPGSPARCAAVHTDAPILSGHGPISPETARRLAGDAVSWHRILTHPVTGSVLDHDRTTYAVPADLRRRLRWRDETCRFPGCRRRAERCDLDHTVAWQDGGRTAADNLAHLCRHHHLVKHRDGPLGRWSVRHLGPARTGGVLEWTSPGGQVYRTVPDALLADGTGLQEEFAVPSPALPNAPVAADPGPPDPAESCTRAAAEPAPSGPAEPDAPAAAEPGAPAAAEPDPPGPAESDAPSWTPDAPGSTPARVPPTDPDPDPPPF